MLEYAKTRLRRLWPLIVVGLAAALGWWWFGHLLSFEALATNREALLALRDSHYGATVLGFIVTYALIVALSLPGASVATLAGGFLFATFPGTIFNVLGRDIGGKCHLSCRAFQHRRKLRGPP